MAGRKLYGARKCSLAYRIITYRILRSLAPPLCTIRCDTVDERALKS